ncbi:carboxymuconolactone decarboxylase family protein [Cupriavidus sp. Marseille-Q8015]
MTQKPARIPFVEPGTRPELAEIEAGILAERGRISILYQALLNSPPLAAGWEKLLTAVRNQNSLPADLRELMIIRVAVLNGADFEYHAHVPHALKAGMAQDKIDALRLVAVPMEIYTPTEQLLIRLTDAMTRQIVVPEEIMDGLKATFDARGVLEAVATVASYNMVSRLLVALDISH